ncbi:bifunctional 3'-5' exonuclease/ATP-dependent helicase WRN-like [Acropora muricata]|uniref:bifunctional 3'-5' exonuclease/ATP-dependent helicase WRN-like n=1 Tax=Acropora muricata TaxID=159855 RepID=UPI0034E45557
MAAAEAGFEESLCEALSGINLETVSLRVKQKEAIRNIVLLKKDTLIILPTGFGKSLIYQLLPFVFDSWLGASKSFVLVVSPLNALMRDQTVKLNDLQVRSLIVRNTESLSEVEIRDIKESKYRIIYGHPEAFVGKLRKILDSEEVRRDLRAVVVDEAHLIVEWKTFRPAYAQLGILGAMFPNVPVVALMATATEKTKSQISSSLGMVKPEVIEVNPNRKNIFYSCSTRPHTGDDKIEVLLLPYIAKLQVMREKMPLTVIYSNLQVCGECFSVFDRYLGEEQYTPIGSLHFAKNRLFAQFHANYPEKEKNDILDELLKGPGKIRVLFVTIAFGIGVDCPRIREVVHIGVPNTMEEYFQESGRAGRDGNPALSKVFYSYSYDISRAQKNFHPVMRKFVSTENCRRRVILEYFGFSIPDGDEKMLLHSCCDNCALNCNCNDCQKKGNN